MKRALAAFAVSIVALAACAQILDLEPPPDGAAPDASPFDVFVPEAGDAAPPTCAPLDAALPNDEAGTTFHPFATDAIIDGGSVSIVDNVNLTGLLANTPSGYEGGAFDGKRLYLAPSTPGQPILAYTVAKSLTSASSWVEFSPSAISAAAGAVGFSGALFDGRYVYFVPHATAGGASGLVLRYDTTLSFIGTGSWSTFDTESLADAGGPGGFAGGVFDGRYVVFSPNESGTATPSGRLARYDTQADAGDAGTFASPSSWTSFDTATVNGLDVGFRGAVSDGRYLYFVPSFNGGPTSSGYSGYIARFDTAPDGGWVTYGVSQKNANAVGFVGGAFDGRYVYYVPHETTTVVRYDTTGGFFISGSYDTFDVAPVVHFDGGAPAYSGAAFDGRYVYFAPSGAGFGIALRYDTLSPFGSTCAWSTLDFTRYNALATDFFGAIYDGRYLYFVPHESVLFRFDTKTPAWMPLASVPGFAGSFY